MKESELKKVEIYTDGGYISNPGGNGGYGLKWFVIFLSSRQRNERKEGSFLEQGFLLG